MEKKHFYAFVIALLLAATFLVIRENYLQTENAKMLEKITQEQTEIMSYLGSRTANAKDEVNIADDEVPLGAPSSESDSEYQAIFMEVSGQMFALTPTLTEEFVTESAEIRDKPESLVKLSARKVKRLSEVLTEGVTKMGALHVKKDAENPEAYRRWVHNLMTVYEQEVNKIASEYMKTVK